MTVYSLISSHIEPATLQTSVNDVIARMDQYVMKFYPMVNEQNGEYTGELNKADLLDVLDKSGSAFMYKNELFPAIPHQTHILDAARIFFRNGRDSITIVDDEGTYLGVLLRQRLLEELGNMLNVGEVGMVIGIELEKKDFLLSQLVRLIEQEGANILGMTLEQPSKGKSLLVSFKLNVTDGFRISSSLKRHGYLVVSETTNPIEEQEFADRADEFLNYLNL